MLRLFRIITSFWTYVILIGSLVFIFIISKTDVFSFRRLPSLAVVTQTKQREGVYMAHKRISEQAILLAYLNISLGHDAWSLGSEFDGGDIHGSTLEQALAVTKQLNTMRENTIFTSEKGMVEERNFDTSLKQGRTLISKGKTLIGSLDALISQQEGVVNSCATKKKKAEDIYNQALLDYNARLIDQSTADAQDATTCISQATVAINSARGVRDSLQLAINASERHISILSNNRDLILRYGAEINSDTPSQLLQIQRELSRL